METSYSYDSRHRIVAIRHKDSNGAVVQSFDYTLDSMGNRIQEIQDNNRTVEYGYDSANRLISEKVSHDANGRDTLTTFSYDDVGNLLTKTIDGNATSFSYNANDQLTQKDSTTFTYDANGNLISHDNITYTYDDKNRVIKVQTPNDSVEFEYDANDNRVAKIVNGDKSTYLIDSNTPYAQVITESKSDGTTIEYTYGNDLLTQNSDVDTLYYLNDALGSTRALANSTGNITDNYTYSPYGALIEHLGISSNTFMFTGEQFDKEIDSYYLRARYYAPNTTRFISRDSYDGTLESPLSQNHYLYTHSNPVMYSDPSGKSTLTSLTSSIYIRGTLQTTTRRTWSKLLNRQSIIEGFVGKGNNSLVTNLVIDEVVNILVDRTFKGNEQVRGSRAHKYLEYKIAKYRPLGQYVKLEPEVYMDDKCNRSKRNCDNSIGIDILVKIRTGKNSYKPMVLIDLKTGSRKKPNGKNGFPLSRAKDHGNRHGNVPVIEVYIPFLP